MRAARTPPSQLRGLPRGCSPRGLTRALTRARASSASGLTATGRGPAVPHPPLSAQRCVAGEHRASDRLWVRLHDLDHRQQQSRRASFIAAVVKKFIDDQAGQLAALIAYYGFVSLFPLLLVLVTILGFVLQGDPGEQRRPQRRAGGVPDHLRPAETAFADRLGPGACDRRDAPLPGWASPGRRRTPSTGSGACPSSTGRTSSTRTCAASALSPSSARSSIISTTAAGFVGTSSHGAAAVVAGVVVAFAFNLALFMTAFKLLTAVDVSWRELLPGVIVASVFWQLLQNLGGFYVAHELKHLRAALRRLRARPRAARVALPGRPAHDLRRRDQRRARARAVAAELLLRAAARGRPAGADLLRRDRGARAGAARRRQLRRPLRPFIWLSDAGLRVPPESACARNDLWLY